MTYRNVIRLAAAGMMFCACQSDSYKIKGYASQLKDGDTITLALEDQQHKILGQTLISEGTFALSGTTDTTVFCRAYLNSNPLSSVSFFLEPGNITIELNPYPKQSRVSGTVMNNEWQKLNDQVQTLGDKLIRTAEASAKTDVANRRQLQSMVDSLHREISGCIKSTAQRNKDNVLGKYIEDNYKEPEFK
jgi:hypothetical protein